MFNVDLVPNVGAMLHVLDEFVVQRRTFSECDVAHDLYFWDLF